MPDEAAAVQLPPADQPPPVPPAQKPFAERWAAVESTVTDDADESPEQPAGEPAKPAKAVDPKEAKRAQLKALADELGLKLDDAGVTIEERAEWRRAKAREKQRLEAERAEWEKTKSLTPEERAAAERGQALIALLEAGDPHGFAEKAGFKDWNDLQHNFLKRTADPNYAELRKLQQELEAQKAEKKKAEEEAKQRAESQTKQEAMNKYMDNLSTQCKASKNPVVAAFGDDPLFLQAVFQIQKENWDPELQQTVPVEVAIKKAMRGAKQDLESELRIIYERGKKAFEVGGAAPASAQKNNGKKPAPKTAVTGPSSGGEGAPKRPGEMSQQEWASYRAKRLAEAED